MSAERRKSIRIKVSIPVKIFGMSGQGHAFSAGATVINLGKHGACLKTNQLLEQGQIVLLETPQAGTLDTEVRWVGDPDASAFRPIGVQREDLAAAFGCSIPDS